MHQNPWTIVARWWLYISEVSFAKSVLRCLFRNLCVRRIYKLRCLLNVGSGFSYWMSNLPMYCIGLSYMCDMPDLISYGDIKSQWYWIWSIGSMKLNQLCVWSQGKRTQLYIERGHRKEMRCFKKLALAVHLILVLIGIGNEFFEISVLQPNRC